MLYRTPKLATDHPFYNIRNKDISAIAKEVYDKSQLYKKNKEESNNQNSKTSQLGHRDIEESHSHGQSHGESHGESHGAESSLLIRYSIFNQNKDSNDSSRMRKDSMSMSSVNVVTITEKSRS